MQTVALLCTQLKYNSLTQMKNYYTTLLLNVIMILFMPNAGAQTSDLKLEIKSDDKSINLIELTSKTVMRLPEIIAEKHRFSNEGQQFLITITEPAESIDLTILSDISIVSLYGPVQQNTRKPIDFGKLKNSTALYTYSQKENQTENRLPAISTPGIYLLEVGFTQEIGISNGIQKNAPVTPVQTPNTSGCISCLEESDLKAGKYLVSAWVYMEGVAPGTTSYNGPQIRITVNYNGSSTTTIINTMVGYIIDDWQLMEGEFNVNGGSTGFSITLGSTAGEVLFDDVRLQPFDASMKSYVYDSQNLRLVAELDERHYATLYEYDEDGKLKRIKKETERGRMTIQETTNSSVKQ